MPCYPKFLKAIAKLNDAQRREVEELLRNLAQNENQTLPVNKEGKSYVETKAILYHRLSGYGTATEQNNEEIPPKPETDSNDA